MSERAYAVIGVVTDHGVRDVEKVFSDRSDAKDYCEEQLEEQFDDIVESEHTHQIGDYRYSNGTDEWGFRIVRTEFVASD